MESSPQASVYLLPRYLEALCGAGGGRFHVLGFFRGEALAAGVALYARQRVSGTFVSPRLLLYYNGIALPEERSAFPSVRTARRTEALSALVQGLATLGYSSVHLRNHHSLEDVRAFLAHGWIAEAGYSYVVDLSEGVDLESCIEPNLRRLIRRCSDGSVSLVEDEDFASFYELHRVALARHGGLPYLPREAFSTFFRQLRAAGLCRLFHARHPDGRSVSSQLVLLGPRRTSHTVAAATDPRELGSGVTAWLRLRVFEALRAGGCAANDLTDASLNSVTHFKSQLGGDLRLCFVLQSPSRTAFAVHTRLEQAAWRMRRAAGRSLRRLGMRTR